MQPKRKTEQEQQTMEFSLATAGVLLHLLFVLVFYTGPHSPLEIGTLTLFSIPLLQGTARLAAWHESDPHLTIVTSCLLTCLVYFIDGFSFCIRFGTMFACWFTGVQWYKRI